MSWAVEVRCDGDKVVTIEDRCLSGRDISEADADLIRDCAQHLLAFVGPKRANDEQLGGRVIAYPAFRVYWEQLGGHIHARVFQRRGLGGATPAITYEQNGTLVFDEQSWPFFREMFSPDVEYRQREDAE